MSRALLKTWEATVRRKGSARAVIEAQGPSATFRELDERARAWLAAQGPGAPGRWQGRIVVFSSPNGIGWLEIFVGLLRAGAVLVPLDPGEPPAAQRVLATALRADCCWDGARFVPLPHARRFRDPEITLMKLTSGTTGRPRPLIFTGAQLLADARQITATMGLRDDDLNYALIPLGHSYGLGNLVIPFLQGIPLLCGTAPLPHAIAGDFVRWQPTVFPGVPALYRALASADVASTALASLRLAISAGAPLPVETAQGFSARFQRSIHNFYGSSETGGIAFDRTGAATLAGGVGPPLRGVKIRVLPGRRVLVCSAAVFTQGNRRREGRRGCWIPPDIVTHDPRGGLILHGRRSATVKIAGRRVNLAEIASSLRSLPGVRDAWVGTNSREETMLGAAVISTLPAGELRQALSGRLAPWKIPKKWAVLAEFPTTSRGKPDTAKLRQCVFGREDEKP